MAEPWRASKDHLVVRMRLTPRSSADRLEGVRVQADGAAVLAARVRALPTDGEANRAAERLLAAVLGVPKSAVSVTAGMTARVKELRIDGDPLALAAALRRAVAGEG